MVVRKRHAKRRPVGAPQEVRSIDGLRRCAADDCTARLSRYNPTSRCGIHAGWDHEIVRRKPRTS
ncbi:MAG TPA: hypothetical protein VG276_15550 [Actinomycetes bacterium]|nr:hypothetical protein [Actinomycetes bacterium]